MDPYYKQRHEGRIFGPQLGHDPPNPTRIYHFTHVDNLAKMLDAGGLLCNNLLRKEEFGSGHVSVANEGIQRTRSNKRVPKGPRGTLHDYVPFYFCFRSPMLYRVHTGQEDYQGNQEELVYFVSSVQSVDESGIDYVFTDRHGILVYTDFFTELDNLSKIDWRLMIATSWHEIAEYRDRKERKQAEFLVHRQLPWSLVGFVAVMNPRMKERVEEIFAEYPSSDSRPVRIERDWYYPEDNG